MNETNAKKLLFTIADVLEDVGLEFFLYGGTFLGAVREKRFIEIDKDVDFGTLIENLAPLVSQIRAKLLKKGINVEVTDHRHKRPWDGSVYGMKFKGFGISSDLSGFKKMRERRAIPSHIGDFWLVHPARFLEKLEEIEFYGRVFKCPSDADGFLTEKYGDWRMPHKRFFNVSKPTCRIEGPDPFPKE